jgi:hypothetical protein
MHFILSNSKFSTAPFLGVSKSLLHFVSWMFKLGFVVRVKIDEVCPKNDSE